MSFKLMDLPYAMDALAPTISQATMERHYGKHHATYVAKLNDALTEADAGKSLEDIIKESHAAGNAAVFNSAAQIWNHDFYWNSMVPGGSSLDNERLVGLIEKSCGSVDEMKAQLKAAALGQFGSGWAWLVSDAAGENLEIVKTANAETPLTTDKVALITIDVWEHAYYLDWQQDRAGYADACIEKLINWEFAVSNLPG